MDRTGTKVCDTPQARRLARERGFGHLVTRHRAHPGCPGRRLLLALLAALGLRRETGRRPADPRTVHGYEKGLVITGPAGAEPYSWQEALPYEYLCDSAHGAAPGGGTRDTPVPSLDLRAPDGTPLIGLAGETPVGRFAALAESGELPRARRCLDAGGQVGYGAFTLTATALTLDGTTRPWREVEGISSTGYRIDVRLRDGGVLTADPRATPHFRTLSALTEQLVAADRLRPGFPA